MFTNYVPLNSVIKWKDTFCGAEVTRLVYIDEERKVGYLMNVFSKDKGYPVAIEMTELCSEIEIGNAVILDKDPTLRLIAENEISEKDRRLRDKVWGYLFPFFIYDTHKLLLDEGSRGRITAQLSRDLGKDPKMIRKYIRRLWQRGVNPNSLLTDYHKCGAPGKKREPAKDGAKRGRPRVYIDILGEGINVDETIKKYFRYAIYEYFLTYQENTIKATYNRLIANWFVINVPGDDGGSKKVIMEDRPTLRQFTHWYDTEGNDEVNDTKKRRGTNYFNLNFREITGDSKEKVTGPGQVYQIDATIADVYLKSSFNKDWIIGRPVVYIIIDVFSRLVTGFYAGFEGPAWEGAMMAMANLSLDKVQFCADFGYSIGPRDWNCNHIPELIVCDNAEVKGMGSDQYINAFQTTVKVVPPGRGDCKGIVERFFRTLQGYVKPFLPGYVIPDLKSRTGKDYVYDARIDIHEFRRMILRSILIHNTSVMNNYERTKEMIEENVIQKPIEIWNWGVQKYPGRLRVFDEDIVRLNLMRAGKATIERDGINYEGMKYTCEKAISEKWFSIAGTKGKWNVDVSYDLRSNMNHIYIRSKDGKSFEKCSLLPNQSLYLDRDIAEVKYQQAFENRTRVIGEQERLQNDVDFILEEEAKQGGKNVSKTTAIKESKLKTKEQMKPRRAIEVNELRKEEHFEIGARLSDNRDAEVVGLVNHNHDESHDEGSSRRKKYREMASQQLNQIL